MNAAASIIPRFGVGLNEVSLIELRAKKSGYSGFLGINCPTDYKINADSKPDYDEWGPDCAWSCADWVNWHKALKNKYGTDEAKTKWCSAYDKNSYAASALICSTGNTDFKNYVLSNDLNTGSTILSKIYKAEVALNSATKPVKDTVGGLADLVANTTQAAANTAGAASEFAKWLPWIALAGLALFGYIIFANQKTLIQKI